MGEKGKRYSSVTKTVWDGSPQEIQNRSCGRGKQGHARLPAPALFFLLTHSSVLWAFIEYLLLPESLEPLILVASFTHGLGASLHASTVRAPPVKQRGESFLSAVLWGRQ